MDRKPEYENWKNRSQLAQTVLSVLSAAKNHSAKTEKKVTQLMKMLLTKSGRNNEAILRALKYHLYELGYQEDRISRVVSHLSIDERKRKTSEMKVKAKQVHGTRKIVKNRIEIIVLRKSLKRNAKMELMDVLIELNEELPNDGNSQNMFEWVESNDTTCPAVNDPEAPIPAQRELVDELGEIIRNLHNLAFDEKVIRTLIETHFPSKEMQQQAFNFLNDGVGDVSALTDYAMGLLKELQEMEKLRDIKTGFMTYLQLMIEE